MMMPRAATAVLALTTLLSVPALARDVDSRAAREYARLCFELPARAEPAPCRTALDRGLSPRRALVVYRELGARLGALERWDDVVRSYEEAARALPAEAETHLRLGLALLHVAGRPADAVMSLSEAVRLGGPDRVSKAASAIGASELAASDTLDVQAALGLGVAWNALARHDEARAAFEEALRLDPSCLETRPAARAAFDASRRGERWPPARE